MQKLLLISFAITSVYGMENKTINLLPFPIEVLDRIAYYLPCNDQERQEEFIERTQKIRIPHHIPEKYRNHIPKHGPVKLFFEFTSAYCPDNSVIAIIEQDKQAFRIKPTVCLVNTKNNQKIYAENVDQNLYSKIAVSRHGDMFALLTTPSKGLYPQPGPTLIIKNIHTQKIEFHRNISLSVPWEKVYPGIAFNKQGTQIIIFNGKYHHIIYLMVNPTHLEVNSKRTFAQYCAQQRICKDLNKQLQ
jgi:hypothetical protein